MNTPYFRGSNEENAMATSPLAPPNTINATPNRRVLGDVSTNPRVFSSPATGAMFSKKVMTGSPLKRTFTAAVEEGYGLKYLKKRRTSGDMGFAPVEQRMPKAAWRHEDEGTSRARSVPEVEATNPDPVGEFPHSPTEPNTPSDSGGETHESFSSLINYDPSSQHVNASQSRQHQPQHRRKQQYHEPPPLLHPQLQPQPQIEQQQQPHPSQSPELVVPTASHAETLKLRLQVAMYKIRTNQVNVPFAELQAREEERIKETNQRRVSRAVEEAVAEMRREAMERMPQNHAPAPKLIPGPLLHPTSYSSRMIQQPQPQPQRQPEPQALGPLAAASLFMANQQAQGFISGRPGSMESAGEGLLDLKNGY